MSEPVYGTCYRCGGALLVGHRCGPPPNKQTRTTPGEMREWTEKKMGFGFVDEWRPDTDMNQCFLLVDRMREEGWYLSLEYLTTGIIETGFTFKKTLPNRPQKVIAYDANPCHAIILAAMATEGE